MFKDEKGGWHRTQVTRACECDGSMFYHIKLCSHSFHVIHLAASHLRLLARYTLRAPEITGLATTHRPRLCAQLMRACKAGMWLARAAGAIRSSNPIQYNQNLHITLIHI